MKYNPRISASILLLGVALFMWSCSDDGDNPAGSRAEFTEDEIDDLADDLAYTVADREEGFLPLWLEMRPGESGGLRQPGGGALDDTVHMTWHGFNVTVVRNYYDALGNRFAIYDPATSVRMDRLTWISGTHTNQSGRRTVTIDHFDSTAVFGIEPSSFQYVVRGSGEREVESEFSSRFRQNVKTLDAVYTWTVNDLVIHHDRSEFPYPLDGSIAVNVAVTRTHVNPGRNFSETVHVSLVIYFDGSRWAEVVFADGRHYWIDLLEGIPLRIRP